MRVVAYFDSPQTLARAARLARERGWQPTAACSPAFNDTVLDVAGAARSPVATAALAGGVVGLLSGLMLTVWTVRQWPGLIVSGKPLVSVPPFLIIMFELTILAASIGAVGSFLVASVRSRRLARCACDARTTDDRFSLLLEATGGGAVASDEEFLRLGANEWRQL
jgi:hypothetical protein